MNISLKDRLLVTAVVVIAFIHAVYEYLRDRK